MKRWHEVRNATPWTSGLLPGDLADVPHAAPAARMAESAAVHGWWSARLDLAGAADKAGFLAACGRDLALPDYYGANWDALWDCLTDETLLPPQRRRLIVVDRWRRFAERDPGDWSAGRNLLREAAGHWSGTTAALVVLIRI
ncbi:barstar family protein [Yinghuangia soli]|uniref:Barstar family protein n=1 Tax=Yinghuangia soli TaxID=2908204 RepID=A0AA41U4X4_9ACTN|nr:barstar family protein [Yinghuangia soli]MCF2531272.1 barstar family protein [Yinghuangia soli]